MRRTGDAEALSFTFARIASSASLPRHSSRPTVVIVRHGSPLARCADRLRTRQARAPDCIVAPTIPWWKVTGTRILWGDLDPADSAVAGCADLVRARRGLTPAAA